MNFGTAITLLIVGVIVFFALRSIVHDVRRGSTKCAECGKGCNSCSTSCGAVQKMAKNLDRF